MFILQMSLKFKQHTLFSTEVFRADHVSDPLHIHVSDPLHIQDVADYL